MARYRTIDIRIWMDAKFMSLDEGSQLLFIYLLTCPQVNQIGTIPMSPSVLAAYLNKPVETVSERLRNLSDMGLIRVDNGNLIWICNFLKYNAPMNPNCAKGLVAFFDEIPDCPLVDEVAEAVVKACEIKGSDYVKAVLPSLKKYLDRRKNGTIRKRLRNRIEIRNRNRNRILRMYLTIHPRRLHLRSRLTAMPTRRSVLLRFPISGLSTATTRA